MDCAMSKEWQSVADQQVAPVDNKPFILDWPPYSLWHNQSIKCLLDGLIQCYTVCKLVVSLFLSLFLIFQNDFLAWSKLLL